MIVTLLPTRAGASALEPPDTTTLPGSDLPASFADALLAAFASADGALQRADAAERAFGAGRGGLQEMVLERAQADVALSIAGAAASRAAQSLSTVLGMQV